MDGTAFLNLVFMADDANDFAEGSPDIQSELYRHTGEKMSFLFWQIEAKENRLKVISADGKHSSRIAFPFPSAEKKTAVHQHDAVELLYVIEGNFAQNISGIDFLFPEKSVVFINRDVLHFDYLNSDATVLFLSIPNTMMEKLFRGNQYAPYQSFISDLLSYNSSQYSHLHGIPKQMPSEEIELHIATPLVNILREIVAPKPGSEYICNGYLIRLFYHLVTDYRFALSDYERRDMRKLLYEEIIRDIQADCSSITIETLQNKYHFNRDYFNRLIREYGGTTFRELRRQIRLETASQLLTETKMKIEEISLAVGYENQGFFYKQFSEKYGKTPRHYRLEN